MPTKKKPLDVHLVKINSDFSRFFDKETVRDLRECKADFNLILPDFKIKYQKSPFKIPSEKKIEENEGYISLGKCRQDFIIKNERSFSESNFWDEIETAHYPYNLFRGKMKVITTLKPSEFKNIFIKKCEQYVKTGWSNRYRDCIIGDFDSVFASFNVVTGKTIKKKHPPLDLTKEGDWGTLNPGVRDRYIKKDREFFYPKITLEII